MSGASRGRHRIPWLVAAGAVFATRILAAEGATPPAPLPLDWCLERALAANPELAAEAAAARAARERIAPAGALEDPRIGYQASNVPAGDLDFDSTPLSGHQLGISQKLPFPGLREARRGAARAGADSANAASKHRERQVLAAVERGWAELGFAQRALEITDRNLELLRQLSRVAETKYAVGTGRQQDVLRAQVELTQLLAERLRRQAALRRAESALARLLDLPPGTPLARTDSLAEETAPPELGALLARLEETSPRLAALRARIAQAESLRRAAAREGLPDFDLGFGYRVRESVPGDPVNGDDFLQAGITVRLPLDRAKWRSRVAERQALLRRTRARYRMERAALRDAIQSSHAELSRADAELSLLRDGLLPQSRQSLEASRSGYEVDAVGFLDLVDSQLSLLGAELRVVRAAADHRAAFAALEAAIGESLR